jgi:hypothetical protein
MTNAVNVTSDEPDTDMADNSTSLDVGVSDFVINVPSSSLSVWRGGQVSEMLTFGAQGGFAGNIDLSCTVTGSFSPAPTCLIAPSSVASGGSATLTISASGLAAWIPLGLLGFALLLAKQRRGRACQWAFCALVVAAAILPAACGGGSGGAIPPAPENFSVTVNAKSGSAQHSTVISLTVH